MKKTFRLRYIIPAIIVIIIVIIATGVFAKKPTYQFFTVGRGDVAQTVSVTGNTTPVNNLDLSFQQSGKITAVYTDVGRRVSSGQILLELDDSNLKAQYASALASTQSQQAKLDSLKNGTRPEDIQIDETNVQKAKTSLQNDYSGVLGTLNDSYIKSENAIQQQIDQIISSPNGTAPLLTFSVISSQTKNDVESGWNSMITELEAWKTEISALVPASDPSTLETALKNGEIHGTAILNYLSRVMDAVTGNVGLSQTLADTYKTNVTTAKTNVNTGLTNIITKLQIIGSDKVAVQQAEDQLALSRAGSTAENIAAQEAAVEQARSSAQSLKAQLNQYILYSPINGTVSRQDGKLGQIAGANQALVTVISQGNLEIDANIPEVNIGSVQLNDPVHITFDAFPGETFEAKVFFIDPAETIVGGVVNYKIKISLTKDDPRIKSGLTANLTVETGKKAGVLVVPALAVIDNDNGTFVRELQNGKTVDVPIQAGIRSSSGNVEILSGVTEGTKVINVGLKQN
jgi:RND family efflux transporter MFP subunit